MISAGQIEKLSSLRSDDFLVSSFYLTLWPDARIHHTRAKDLIREKREKLKQEVFPPLVQKALDEDWEEIRKFVENMWNVSQRGLVIFSSTAAGIWEVYPLAQPVRDLLIVDHSAYIRPLSSILDRYRRVCTLLVDQNRARIFEVFMGEMEEQLEIYDEVPAKVREAGWYGLAEKRIERHVEQHRLEHLKKVSDRTFHYFQQRGFDWLFLGGQSEIVSELQGVLHPYLQERLKKIFRLEIFASPKEVLEKTLELEQEAKREEDQLLVSQLANGLGPGGLGVTGLEETLSSLYHGEVNTLLVEEGFARPGAYCPACGYMGLQPGVCPLCRAKTIPVPDIVDEAVSRAIDQNGTAFQISAGAGLHELGSIGAILRYKVDMGKKEEAKVAV